MRTGLAKNEGRSGVFINLSNHPSGAWSEKQKADALKYGQIADVSFPKISANLTDKEINRLVDEYYELVMRKDDPVVLLQGEFVFVFRLAKKLKEAGIRVVSACSERCAREEVLPDGSVLKSSMFVYRGLRDY